MGSVNAFCRFCAHKLERSRSRNIFSPENSHLLVAARQCIPRTISADDPYPNFACYPCVYKLNNFNEFQDNGLSALKVFDDKFSAKAKLAQTPNHTQERASSRMASKDGTDDFRGTDITSPNLKTRLKFHQFLTRELPNDDEAFSEEENLDENDTFSYSYSGTATSKLRRKVRGQAAQDNAESNNVSYKTRGPGKKPYRCEECHKCFGNPSHLKEHLLIHTGEKPHQCKKCKKCFRQKPHLQVHERSCLKQMQPKNCEESLKPKTQIIARKRGRPFSNPFQCETCEKRFKLKSYLLQHKRVHTGEKPYHCNECGKSFTFHSNLSLHKRTHAKI